MKIKTYLSIGYLNANREGILEIDDSELEGLTDEEKSEIINEYVRDWANRHIDMGYEIVKR